MLLVFSLHYAPAFSTSNVARMKNEKGLFCVLISSSTCGFNPKTLIHLHKGGVFMQVKRVAIYTRVSTNDQNPEIQEDELVQYVARRGWEQHKVYCDKGISGAAEKRPALTALFEDCRRRKIDVVVVWKFDRFARSLRQLLNALDLFRHLGIDFVSCTEAIDTSLPHGEMLFQIIEAIAQWERSLIGERVKAGLQHARSQGKRLGRPPLRQLMPEEVVNLRNERRRTKAPFRKLAAKYGVSVFTAHMICTRQALPVSSGNARR